MTGRRVRGCPVQEFTRPPVPGQEVAPSVLSRPVAKLVFSTGDVVDVDRVILQGVRRRRVGSPRTTSRGC